MSLELPPLLADWLADATFGVNAILATVPRDGGDPLPPNVTVYDEVRDPRCARRIIPPEMVPPGHPAIAVYQSAEAVYPLARPQRGRLGGAFIEGTATYLVLYIQRESDSVAAASAARYTLRAVLHSLVLLHDAKSGAVLTRNGAQLVAPLQFKMSTLLEERGDVLVTGGVLADYKVRELVQFIP